MAAKSAENGTGFDKSVDRIRDNVKSFAHSVSDSAADGVDTLADQGADGIKGLAGRVPDVSGWLDEKIDMARERVRDEPIKMMAIAAGVGALIGAVLLRR
ncbi:MAG: DUF883 C-terminal domain-containing protein [Micropepsaceae bacterium]